MKCRGLLGLISEFELGNNDITLGNVIDAELTTKRDKTVANAAMEPRTIPYA